FSAPLSTAFAGPQQPLAFGVTSPSPTHAESSSRDGNTPLLLTSPSTLTSGSPASPLVSSAALTSASPANAAGCCARLNRSTETPWDFSQSRSAANRTSCGSTEGPQIPVEQHMAGSKTRMAVMGTPWVIEDVRFEGRQ